MLEANEAPAVNEASELGLSLELPSERPLELRLFIFSSCMFSYNLARRVHRFWKKDVQQRLAGLQQDLQQREIDPWKNQYKKIGPTRMMGKAA